MRAPACFSLIVLLAACGPASQPAADSTQRAVPQKENFEKGRVLQLSAAADGANSFALYLPANFDTAKKWPLLVFFDPQAGGSLPLQKYKAIADRYGYVLAGSNVIKNGMDPRSVTSVANALITDLQQRLPCDPKRLYLAGFSGGARMAGVVAAQRQVRGVIGCSAGFVNPQAVQAPGFACISIAGLADMNYNESQRQDQALREVRGARTAFFSFDGKHEWPPATVMETAIECLEFYAMRDGLRGNEQFDILFESVSRKLDSIKEKDVLAAADYQQGIMTAMDSANGLFVSWSKLTEFKSRPAYLAARKSEDRLLMQEQQLQAYFGEAMSSQQLSWWEESLTQIDTSAKLAPRERLMRRRVWAYLSLVAYSYANQGLQQNDQLSAAHFLTLYARVDPKNPEWAYMRAKFEMNRNDKAKALDALDKAVELGFRDRRRLEAEPGFKILYTEQRFQEVLKKIVG